MTWRSGFGLAIITVTMVFAVGLAPAASESYGEVGISFEFDWIRQGQVGIVRVTGPDLVEVRAVFQERLYYFYEERGAFVGLISADMEAEVADYTMQVWVKYNDGTAERIDQTIPVNYGEFGRSDVNIPAALIPLLAPEVEDAERNKLFNIMDRFTPQRYWAGGFVAPSTEELIGWFGTWRLYNGSYWKRHTGLDVRMPIGTPVPAIANGRVMLAEILPIRGGYILIDHGWGVYSGYAHLSERLVVPGQWVRQGDIIGLSGMNGRSSGAHLHWEMAVGGAWVDPEAFLSLGLDVDSD
ncbi:MAG: M23 family metallopeptidase [Anaerolineae bacterium]|nr:M23 family metallopeptidase [Anaerolineae bacterium]